MDVTQIFSKQRQLYDSIGVSRNDLSYKGFIFEWFERTTSENRAPITLFILNDNAALTFIDILLDMLSIEKIHIAAIVFNVQTQQLRH